MNRRNLLLTSAAVAAACASPFALAQDSGQPIRLIVPYAPGGPIDVTARALAERVKDSLGTVIIDNNGGAGGNIGAAAIAKAAPDGLTIGIAATATHAVNPWLYAKMPFDAAKDFAGITQMVRVPNVLVMNAAKAEQLKIHTLADLIAYAKAHPAQLNYGSGGNGSAGHLAGEVDFNIDNLAAAAPNIRAGKLKALAVTSLIASPSLPGVPPLSATFKGFAIDTWWGLVAPAATPKPVVEKLNKAFVAALNAPETKARFGALLAEPVPTTPQQFDSFMAAERAKYQQVVKASGAKVD